ncbi:MAG: hypothetical protein ABUL60_22180 [Myxococcales bacterium]
MAYPVLGTLALWTGFVEWVIQSEDVKVEIDNPSYTIFPGRVHLKHVKVYVNGDTQFILEGSDLLTDFSLFGFFRHRVHVTTLAAHDVRYQMRVQVKDQTGMHERLAAYPKLEGLPGKNVIHEKVADKTETREPSWTVAVEGLDVRVVELWFFEYRYLGKGELHGGFLVGPHVMKVTTAVQDIGPGELRFGEKEPIARNFRGQITCNIPEINPEEHADASFTELVDARVRLDMDVLSLVNVGAYFDAFDVSQGAGPLSLDLFMTKGYLGQRSKLSYSTDLVRVKGDGFGVASDWRLNFDASGEHGLPLGQSDAKSTYVSLAKQNREFTVQVHGHHEEAALDTIRLGGATDLKRAALRMPNIVSTDLDDLNVVFPEASPVRVQGGEARASVSLDMDEKYWIRGPLSAEILRSQLDVAGVQLSGNTWLKAHARLNPKLKTNYLEDLTLRLRNVGMHVKNDTVDGWWMDLSSKQLAFWNTAPSRAQGSISIQTKNLQPALEALADKDVVSDIVPMLTRLDNFRAKTTFRREGKTTDVTLESESDVWDAAGRVYSSPKQSLMALVVGGQAVSLGVANMGDGLTLRPFAKTDWLNSRLAEFPKPLVQMTPDKP